MCCTAYAAKASSKHLCPFPLMHWHNQAAQLGRGLHPLSTIPRCFLNAAQHGIPVKNRTAVFPAPRSLQTISFCDRSPFCDIAHDHVNAAGGVKVSFFFSLCSLHLLGTRFISEGAPGSGHVQRLPCVLVRPAFIVNHPPFVSRGWIGQQPADLEFMTGRSAGTPLGGWPVEHCYSRPR